MGPLKVPIVAKNRRMPNLHSFRGRLRLLTLTETVLGLQLVREWMVPGVRGCRRPRGWFRLLGLTAQGGVPSPPLRGHRMGALEELCKPGGCGTPDVVGGGPHRADCTIRDQELIFFVMDSGY